MEKYLTFVSSALIFEQKHVVPLEENMTDEYYFFFSFFLKMNGNRSLLFLLLGIAILFDKCLFCCKGIADTAGS